MKKIVFLTGARADYGKLKSLIQAVEQSEEFEAYIYVSGMHLLEEFGNTYEEVLKDGYRNVYVAYGLINSKSMSYNLGDVICGFTGYVNQIKPDMIVVHGDRIDALAGATVGLLNNIYVAHIEGGELSGTVDESIRHAVSKLAHIHLVCNEEAKKRLLQLGETEERIRIIGSPDIDVMMSKKLPTLEMVKSRYEICFEDYAILMYHPVTTEQEQIRKHIMEIVAAAKVSQQNYVVIYPNNDSGAEIIIDEYRSLKSNHNFRIFPSLRFEYFLTLLKNAKFIIGNSSAGVRESSVYGIPAIDIGSRQSGRYSITENSNIQHVVEKCDEIVAAIDRAELYHKTNTLFGDGNSTERFMNTLRDEKIWSIGIQKYFVDLVGY